MREFRSLGSVRGAARKGRPYHERRIYRSVITTPSPAATTPSAPGELTARKWDSLMRLASVRRIAAGLRWVAWDYTRGLRLLGL